MVKKLLVTSIIVGSGILGSGMAASAGSNLCPSDRACIYDDNNFVALLGTKGPDQPLTNVSSGANDKTDSWENKTNTTGAWYYDANGGGKCNTMGRHDENPNLSVFPSDELSSWKTTAGC
jgi:Peptidase inhibitor family I36